MKVKLEVPEYVLFFTLTDVRNLIRAVITFFEAVALGGAFAAAGFYTESTILQGCGFAIVLMAILNLTLTFPTAVKIADHPKWSSFLTAVLGLVTGCFNIFIAYFVMTMVSGLVETALQLDLPR
jgi:hypothetical protein